MMGGFKLLVFDWDGTLMDSTDHIVSSFQGAIRELDLPEPDAARIRSIIGLGLGEAVASLYPEAPLPMQERLVQTYRRYYFERVATPMRPYAGAKELLDGLAERGFWLAVATGKSRRGLDQALAESGLGRYFFATRCAEETASKPDPLMLRELMFEAGAEPSQTLMVGDTWFDLEMARRADVPAVGLAHGAHGRQELESCGPLAILDDLPALGDWLRQARFIQEAMA